MGSWECGARPSWECHTRPSSPTHEPPAAWPSPSLKARRNHTTKHESGQMRRQWQRGARGMRAHAIHAPVGVMVVVGVVVVLIVRRHGSRSLEVEGFG
jgi:hypothetical protein